jgi:hypothetical protein
MGIKISCCKDGSEKFYLGSTPAVDFDQKEDY